MKGPVRRALSRLIAEAIIGWKTPTRFRGRFWEIYKEERGKAK